jgi:type IV pilus assembly protein PilY1
MFKTIRSACLVAFAVAASGLSMAEDIDIFLTRSETIGATGKPNVMLLVDNTSNWARQAQAWPDNGGTQGAAELAAFKRILNTDSAKGLNVGLAGYTSLNGGGGYIRYGIRDMGVTANKNALTGILDYILGDNGKTINAASEKVNSGSYETAAMYEIYKYFRGETIFRGQPSNRNDPARNADTGNNNTSADAGATAFLQNNSLGNWAISGSRYNKPTTVDGCSANVLIMVINNAQGGIPSGDQSYEGVSAGSALEPIQGVTETSWTDEWARFLYQNGISVYILDAYNAQQNVSHSKVLQRAASVGGGKYYAVKSQQQIELTLEKIFAEINARDSTFASAALPVSSSNRSQYLNQVFVGMFRPDPAAQPRWLGNLKKYKLGLTASGGVDLLDARNQNAVNSRTGFLDQCAISAWTTHSGNFWANTTGLEIPESTCSASDLLRLGGGLNSDLPDGPAVAKGGVAQVIRNGNAPPSTNLAPAAWSENFRRILTVSGGTLTPITRTITGWSENLLKWVTGWDDNTLVDNLPANSEYISASSTPRIRPSIHGDIIHSRPLPVSYGDDSVTVFYGAGDGTFRAVDAETGRERWAFIAPEHFGKFDRLKTNDPLVFFPGMPRDRTQPKDYFFDGSTGLYQNANNSEVWIFPSQRRGGRMLYGLNVTDRDSPELMWRLGCDQNGTCTDNFQQMGQTWSQPLVALIKGYPTVGNEKPVLIVGGGYDPCEDADSITPTCTGRKGNIVYVIDARTGALVKSFGNLNGSVAADLSLADRNGDGFVDFAYAVTTTGYVYRISFTDTSYVVKAPTQWGSTLIANTTTADGRKFLNAPALMAAGSTSMYLALGSGDRERPLITNYPYTSPVTNRLYVFIDDLAQATPGVIALDATTAMQNASTSTTCDSPSVLPGGTKKGWFMDLTGRGEQTITTAEIVAGMVTFSTIRPKSGTDNQCSATASLGEARGYWVNLLNASGAIGVGNATCGGERFATFMTEGFVPSPTVVTVKIDGKVQTIALGAIQRTGGASSGIAPQVIKPPIRATRRAIYWRTDRAE